ncbi:HD domain-containing protein [Olivibacter sitiensis]|uniref:HD domain-containing protein n=1 Tax=Olivibacter sitiensis TaxID=376470 RepID=UPI00041009EC|nr:HD domain-containing protein [Olivibacter sitiensis]
MSKVKRLETVAFVKERLDGAEAGHDWLHTERVWQNALHLMRYELADEEVVEYASLLHDIADSKFHDGDEELGPRLANEFLTAIGVSERVVEHVCQIIRYMSYRSSLSGEGFRSKELEVVQDADRLDAIGAIGIARAFNYGGHKNRLIYDPLEEPLIHTSKEAYQQSTASTISHFYEKLLLLKDKMNTQAARKIAESRHRFMELYLEQFYGEWNGKR